MANPQKNKGSQWERDVAQLLRDEGFPFAERRYGAGATQDKGDINGIPPITFECKNQRRWVLSEWMKETKHEQENAKTDFGILVVKKPGTTDAGQGYAMMPLREMARLLKMAGY